MHALDRDFGSWTLDRVTRYDYHGRRKASVTLHSTRSHLRRTVSMMSTDCSRLAPRDLIFAADRARHEP